MAAAAFVPAIAIVIGLVIFGKHDSSEPQQSDSVSAGPGAETEKTYSGSVRPVIVFGINVATKGQFPVVPSAEKQ